MKRSKPRTLSIGSYSSGTMRSEDLIPAFISAAEDLRLSRDDRATINKIRKESDAADEDAEYWQEDASEDVNTLFDLLDRYCPEYCSFGAHEGDGADYGCWPSIESAQEDMQTVSDLSEAKKAAAMVLLVNDHGNATLYRRGLGGKWIEVWAIV
jgi:hypothetical protein